jgi:hypothetical protein
MIEYLFVYLYYTTCVKGKIMRVENGEWRTVKTN